jgi:hypothetical protein
MAIAIQQGRPHRCNAALARHVIDVMTGVLQSGETRAWVTMKSECDRPEFLSADEAGAMLVNQPA